MIIPYDNPGFYDTPAVTYDGLLLSSGLGLEALFFRSKVSLLTDVSKWEREFQKKPDQFLSGGKSNWLSR